MENVRKQAEEGWKAYYLVLACQTVLSCWDGCVWGKWVDHWDHFSHIDVQRSTDVLQELRLRRCGLTHLDVRLEPHGLGTLDLEATW